MVPSKLPLNTYEAELKSYFKKLKQLTAVRHRNILLRAYHGDIFSHERMKRMRLSDTDECPTCGAVETREHLLLYCPQTFHMWEQLSMATGSNENPTLAYIFGINDKSPLIKIKAEIIGVLLRKERIDVRDVLPIRISVARLKIDRNKGLKRLITKITNKLNITV